MQIIKTSRDTLLKPLQVVGSIVERRHTLPILSNILIRKQGDGVSFISTDIEMQMTTSANLSEGSDKLAAITVPARKLLDILRVLPDDQEVAANLLDKRLQIQCGKSKFTLQTLAADDFPLMLLATDYVVSVEITQKNLRHLLDLVYFAMAQQDIRYYLNGVLFSMNDSKLSLVATDGHRLALSQLSDTGEQKWSRHEMIVPRKTILELQRLLSDTDDIIKIDAASQQVRFSFGSIEIISKLIEGKFPDYEKVIPSHQNGFQINRETLLRALQRVAILTSEKFKGVRCIIADNVIKLSSTNTEQEEAVEEIEIDYSGNAIDIGFNVSYLLDVLSNLKSENIRVALTDSNSSALITIPGEDDFRYVVMPMRI